MCCLCTFCSCTDFISRSERTTSQSGRDRRAAIFFDRASSSCRIVLEREREREGERARKGGRGRKREGGREGGREGEREREQGRGEEEGREREGELSKEVQG